MFYIHSCIFLPGKYVVLKHRDVVIHGEVYGGLESHGLQGGVDRVAVMKGLPEKTPGDYSPVVCVRVHICMCVSV